MADQTKGLVIVGNPNEFLAKNLKTAIEQSDLDLDVRIIKYSVDELHKLDITVCGLIFIIESTSSVSNFLNFAKDFMNDKTVKMYGIMIGEEVELAEASKYLAGCKVISCNRPIAITDVVAQLKRLDAEQKKDSQKKRILIIDDDPVFLRTMKTKLSNAYRVFVANSGASGIMVLSKHEMDLILLDIEMPVTTGPKVMEMLQNEPKLSSIPVMYLSGRCDVKTVTEALVTKPVNYLTKTQSLDEIYATIGAFFAESEMPSLYRNSYAK